MPDDGVLRLGGLLQDLGHALNGRYSSYCEHLQSPACRAHGRRQRRKTAGERFSLWRATKLEDVSRVKLGLCRWSWTMFVAASGFEVTPTVLHPGDLPA